MTRHPKFASLTVGIYDIEWQDVNSQEFPTREEYSIGFETLVQNGIVTNGADGLYEVDDSEGLKFLVRDMLKDDYGGDVQSFAITVYPNYEDEMN